jgi:YegS/Rv2252/BmrU family lipid kinase
MTRRCVILINPTAGRGRGARYLPAIQAVLDKAAVQYTASETSDIGHARALAAGAAAQGDLVVAVGGDGTVSAIAGAVASSRPAGDGVIAVIPAGRGNDLARTHGIPFNPVEAARLLVAGQPRPMDLMTITGSDGAQATATGCVYLGIAAAAGEIANNVRLIRGPLVYPIAALRALSSWKPTRFTVDVTGPDSAASEATVHQDFHGYGVVVANFPYFGAGMKIAPGADSADGIIEVVHMYHAPKLIFISLLMKIRNGTHVELDQVSLARGRAVSIMSERPRRVGVDGELVDLILPLDISVRTRALNVITPV